jgi:hypothetical protein
MLLKIDLITGLSGLRKARLRRDPTENTTLKKTKAPGRTSMVNGLEIETSPLSQRLAADDKAVMVEILRGDAGGWTLEIIDEFGTSTIWDHEFDTDAAALNEAKATIREEGIDSLICTDPWVMANR